MLMGFAKQSFFETYQRTPWQIKSHKDSSWPFLEKCVSQHRISYLDYMLTKKILSPYNQVNEGIACLICHLILAARQGHLCIQMNGNQVEPDPEQLWQGEENQSLTFEEIQHLNKQLEIGLKELPSSLVFNVQDSATDLHPHQPICRDQNLLYLQRHWMFESIFLTHLKRQLVSHPRLTVPLASIQTSAYALLDQGIILPEQAHAIIKGCLHPFSVITGGPGTGKTYTAGYLIKVLWDNLTQEQKAICKIILAAPTGKAAANLQNSLNRVAANLAGFPLLEAKTLHAWLGIKTRKSNQQEKPRLLADIILIDESSMIDVKLMASLFQAVQAGSRLILMGDPCQLPSVEAGSLFSDLIDLNQSKQTEIIPSTELKVCLRAELKSITHLASLIKEGKGEETLHLLKNHSQTGIHHFFMPQDRREGYHALLRHIGPLFPFVDQLEDNAEAILNLFNRVRLLSPMRKGAFGVEALNQMLGDYFSQLKQQTGWLAIPIIIVTNDHRQRLFNGETGVLMRQINSKGGFQAEDYALFSSKDGSQEIRKIPALLLPKYEYAYCLSVHKSQGSEFDRVILVMPEGSELFGREIFYTAVTRARKQLDIFASESVVLKTINQKGMRQSGIQQRYENHVIKNNRVINDKNL